MIKNLHVKLILHPTAVVSAKFDSKIFIRMPDGQRVSFDSNGLPFMELLLTLKEKAHSVQEIISKAPFNEFSSPIESFFNTLVYKNILVAEDDYVAHDELTANYDYIARRLVRAEQFEAKTYKRTKYEVIGEGFVADICKEVARNLGRVATSEDAHENVITLVCRDADDYAYFNTMNEELVGCNKKAMYIWKSGSKFNIGPFVVPNDSPCFNCFEHRQRSNVHFIDEFDASLQDTEALDAEIDDQFGTLEGLVRFLLTRHLTLVANDVYGLASAGNLYEFNSITASMEEHPIVKLPRCGVCGNAKEDNLTRAVRDLL